MNISATTILDYWFSERIKKSWFNSTPELDREILKQFEPLWERAASGALNHWAETAEGALALLIILDQLPLNMFRNQAKSFQTEQLAVQITRQAIAQQLDKDIAIDRRAFFYMPLMHSEKLVDQELSVSLFEQNSLDANLRFAKHHKGIIEQFGRFPHRNRILNRQSTAQEIDYLNSKSAFLG